MAVERGDLDRVMFLMPPRHGKSELVSIRFPSWYLGKHPERHIIGCSYNDDLALEFGGKARDLAQSGIHKVIFPDKNARVSGQTSSKQKWDLVGGGGYIAAGIGGAITGRGGNVLLIDDPIKNQEEAESLTYRERTWKWYQSTAYTRLEKNGAVIIILTRWHKDDLAGRLLKEQASGGDKWHVVKLPAIATEDEQYRKKGEALWPAKKSLDDLLRIKAVEGSRGWASLYQQTPTEEEGNIVKRSWFRLFDEVGGQHQMRIQSWDTAFKEKRTQEDKNRKVAYSCCETWVLTNTGFWLEDVWREQVGFPDLKRMVKTLATIHKPDIIIIEDKASGISLIQELQLAQDVPLYGFDPGTSSKLVRLLEATPMIEGGLVHIKGGQPWTGPFIDECADAGPAAEYMDQVDAMSQALKYLKPQFALWGAIDSIMAGQSEAAQYESVMGGMNEASELA